MNANDIGSTLIALEQRALDRWCQGDPSGFLEISAPDVVYFDPFLERRMDGLEALTAYYENLRGQINASRHEMLNPKVQVVGDGAVLTFNFHSWGGNGEQYRWNCTEVYRREGGEAGDPWRIIQTHWSFSK